MKTIKKGAYLINTSRGAIIDTSALVRCLDKKLLAGAGLDVLEEECDVKEECQLLSKLYKKTCDPTVALQNHILMHRPNVLITPHNAFNSKEALMRILNTTLENINAFVKKKAIHSVV